MYNNYCYCCLYFYLHFRRRFSADKPLMMPVNWPKGTYAVPKPTDGCPDQDQSSRWLEGWLRQNTETQDPDSTWTTAHLSGIQYIDTDSMLRYLSPLTHLTYSGANFEYLYFVSSDYFII